MAKIPSDTQWSDLAAKVKAKQDALTAGTGIDATELASDTVEVDGTVVMYEDDSATASTSGFVAMMMNMFYPVGSYYETSDELFDPNTEWGGTWVEDTAGRVLVAKDNGTFATVGGTGGEETHTLTVAELASHTHGDPSGSQWAVVANQTTGSSYRSTVTSGEWILKQIGSAGDSQAHNNLQPYTVVKRWHRTA